MTGWVSCWMRRVFSVKATLAHSTRMPLGKRGLWSAEGQLLPTVKGVGLAAAVALLMLGCSKEDWVPPKKDPVYKAEITNTDSGIIFHKMNDFAWTNVVFTLNKEYIFSVTEVRAGQFKFIIDFGSFKHKDTGEPFDPTGVAPEDRVWRMWIEGDEGYWY